MSAAALATSSIRTTVAVSDEGLGKSHFAALDPPQAQAESHVLYCSGHKGVFAPGGGIEALARRVVANLRAASRQTRCQPSYEKKTMLIIIRELAMVMVM